MGRSLSRNDIIGGNIWRQLLTLFYPIMLGMFFQQLYNTVDAVIVGNFVGKEALAAVGGSTSHLINLLVNFFTGLSSGATVVISQYYGGDQRQDTAEAVHTAFALALAGGAGIMLIGLFGSKAALTAMGVPDDVMVYALTYIRVYFCGMIPAMIYNMGSGILRAVGDTKRPFYFLMAAALTNIVLDLLFVVVFHLSVFGVGLATTLSQLLSAVLTLRCFLRTPEVYRLSLKKIRFHMAKFRNIILIGFPAGLQSTMYSISNITIQGTINSFGTNYMAAWTAFGKTDSLFWLGMNAIGISITTFMGQNFGARRYDRLKQGFRIGTAITTAITLLITGLIYFGCGIILRLFTSDPEVLALGMRISHFLPLTYVTYIAVEVCSASIRGTGESLRPMLITCGGICVFRVLWILLVTPHFHDFFVVIASYPISWLLTSVIFLIYYYKGHWLQKRISLQSAAS